MLNNEQLEQFINNIEVDPITGCWLWRGHTSTMGFAIFTPVDGYAIEVARAQWGGIPMAKSDSLHMSRTPFSGSSMARVDTIGVPKFRLCRTRGCVCPDADHDPNPARRAFRRHARAAGARGVLQLDLRS
jgi:hypothetical protein